MLGSGLITALFIWVGSIVAGIFLGKYKGREGAGIALTVLLGLLGLLILACLPRTDAAKIAEAQKQYAIQAEAARRAGYPYPPPQPFTPYPAYPPEGQQPYPPFQPQVQQPYPQSYPQPPPPGQWPPPPPPGSSEQPPPGTWPGPHQ
jgi:hypothetical protein